MATTANTSSPTVTELLNLFEQLYTIRRFEERTAELFSQGLITGTAHSCIGQEAVAVGAAAALRPDDYIAGHHRSHGHVIAKGGDLRRMMAELLGRSTGYCSGLGGSMHIADLELGILGCNGIVGAGLPLACGAALAATRRGTGQVAVAFFGDGAVNQGQAHEAFNLATTWRLPVVFVCENNQFALSASWQETRAVESIAARANGYGMEGVTTDGNDVLAVREAVGAMVSRARNGAGPSLLEAKTYRIGQHSMRTNLPESRDEAEFERWRSRDPVERFRTVLQAAGVAPEQVAEVESRVKAELEDAVAAAIRDEPLAPHELDGYVYAPPKSSPPKPPAATRAIGFAEAIQEALELEMAADESVIVMGEDVGRLGGIFGFTRGLWEQFGSERVLNTPISEGGFVGAGVGAALSGLRPVVEIQIFDFVTLAMDALVNQAAKFRYMTGGTATVPLVVRGPSGGGVRLAAQHSQSLEAWFAHVPGLIVVTPSGPADAKGLLAAAIQDDNPVVILEAKSLLFGEPEEVPIGRYAIELGKAAVKHDGNDVTLIATQGLVPVALRAARQLHAEGVSVEVIDPRTLYPLDLETITKSVAKTSRVVIAHEAVEFCGIGAELSALVAQHAFWDLDAPPTRVAAPHRPMPYQRELELDTIPGVQRIVEAIRGLA